MQLSQLHSQVVTPDSIITQEQQIDSTTLQELYDQLDWSDTKRVLRQRPSQPKEKKEDEPQKERTFKLGGTGFQIMGYVLVLALIGFILYLILSRIKIDPGAQRVGYQPQEIEEIEDIEEIDAHAGLRAALLAGDYRQALSMHYILVLQRLAATERIYWQPSKTNRDYIDEMRQDPDGADFKRISQAYESAVYGDQAFGESQYKVLLPILDHLAPTQTMTAHE